MTPNAARWAGRVFYNHTSGNFYFWASTAQTTSHTLSCSMWPSGLVVSPSSNSTVAESCIIAWTGLTGTFLFCNFGAVSAALSSLGLNVGPNAGGAAVESCKLAGRNRVAMNPTQFGIHLGMITQNAASIAVVASAKTYASFIEVMYARQTTATDGRINYNNRHAFFQFLLEMMRLEVRDREGAGAGPKRSYSPL